MATSTKKHAKKPCVIPGGFTVLPLQFSADSVSQHSIYIKEHRVRAEKTSHRPLDRTLFVINIPPYCTEEVVHNLFTLFGEIQSVELMERPGATDHSELQLSKYFRPAKKEGFSVAYIVFKKASSVKAAKSHPHNIPLVVSTEQQPIKVGLKKWIDQYRQSVAYPDKLQEAVDTYMQEYDRRKEEESQQLKKEGDGDEEEDDEGWVKVTRGTKGSKARPHTETANRRTLQKEDKKRKRKELINFYAWQHRQTQREHIAELRKKFEEDKQRIALMRAQRKFRPY
ncbi:ribosomal RNA-processing protein 7 homolog A [Paramormyrops kingsleyae]|uniref:ribosomal RNA-processing protein 7 homolog A n=1 Tax=Paramormyrops kingsleyae TaxID=1676925 RepID=UPI003B971257